MFLVVFMFLFSFHCSFPEFAGQSSRKIDALAAAVLRLEHEERRSIEVWREDPRVAIRSKPQDIARRRECALLGDKKITPPVKSQRIRPVEVGGKRTFDSIGGKFEDHVSADGGSGLG